MGVVANDLKEKVYKSAYLLFGEEAYLRTFYKNALKKAMVNEGDNLNFSYFEGTGTEVNEVINLLTTMPFMAEHRVVIVENSGWFSKTGSSDEESATDAGNGRFSELIDTIKALDEDTIIIFSEEKVDKRSKLYKTVQNKGVAEEFVNQTEDSLAKWIFNYAKALNTSIDSNTAYYLVSECGKDMNSLQNELEKLVAYCLERKVITKADVDNVCTHQVNNKIFDMITAIALHKQKEALRLYYDLLTLREPPFYILTLLSRQYTQMLSVKDGVIKGQGAGTIASKTGIKDWLVKRLMEQTRSMSTESIKKNLRACAKADEDIKTGNLTDMLSVELLIISCSM